MFVQLHNHTIYSLLDGASKLPELVAKAKELGMNALAITDHGNMYGAIPFCKECEKQGIKPIIGCEMYITKNHTEKDPNEPNNHLILLAKNNEGYKNLVKLVSEAQLNGFYRKPRIDMALLRQHAEGLICLSACIAGEIPRLIISGNYEKAKEKALEYREIFGDDFYLEIQNHGLREETATIKGITKISEETDIRIVATNDAHYVNKDDAEAQDILLAIQTQSKLSDESRFRFPNDQFYFKSEEEMLQALPGFQYALDESGLIAEKCNFRPETGKFFLPKFDCPNGLTEAEYLKKLCEERLPVCFGPHLEEATKQLKYELDVIHTMGYDAYFLIVWDFIRWCRNNGVYVGPGRGSAAGSIVAYLLEITKINPLRYGLFFERFLNPARVSMPDIDTDFGRGREKAIQYVSEKYGKDCVCQIITFNAMKAKGAIRDIGRTMGLEPSEYDRIAKLVPADPSINTINDAFEASDTFLAEYKSNPQSRKIIDMAKKIEGIPKTTGIHAAGIIISPDELSNHLPLQWAKGENGEKNIVSQYPKDECEEMGSLKMDFLGLSTLTIIQDTLEMIKKRYGRDFYVDRIPLDDPKTFEMLRKGDTAGVFQLESEGITKELVALNITRFEDISALEALYRPGPLESGMDKTYIACKNGRQEPDYLHPSLKPVLEETYGCMLYQEQIMKIAQVLAGFSLAEADNLRRAMGKKKAKLLESMRDQFVDGAKRLHDIDAERSNYIFDLMLKFAGYGFNKSHSVAYAFISYQTAYLKAHFPEEYMCAVLNSAIGEQEKLMKYIAVAKNMKLSILPPDINESGSGFTSCHGHIRFGLNGIKKLGEAAVEEILKARTSPFENMLDVAKRTEKITAPTLENLIKSGAFDGFGHKRSELLASVENIQKYASSYKKQKASNMDSLFCEEEVELKDYDYPALDEMDESVLLDNEKELLGFYVSGHPLDHYDEPKELIADAKPGRRVHYTGVLSELRIFMTRNGDPMAIGKLEDKSDTIKAIFFPKTLAQNPGIVSEGAILNVTGFIKMDRDKLQLNVNKFERAEPIAKKQ